MMGGFDIIGSGLSLIGGHLRDDRTEERQRWSFEQNERLQKEFAQNGIRWRVADAQEAGVHPLYALGSGVTPGAPIHVGEGGDGLGSALTQMGQDISRATRATMTPEQRAEHNAKLAVMESQAAANNAQAMFYQSRAFRYTQEDNPTQAAPGEESFWSGATTRPVKDPSEGILVRSLDQHGPGKTGAVLVKPDEAPSTRPGDRSISAADKPALSEYNVTPYGTKIRLPYSQEGISEALEGIPWYLWPAIIAHNVSHYGPDWGRRMLREFVFDQPPLYRSNSPTVRGSSMDPGRHRADEERRRSQLK